MSNIQDLASPLETLLPPNVQELFSPLTIRTRSRAIANFVREGHGLFHWRESKLADCADYVVKVTRTHYPDLNIPIHGRWNHFKVQGHDFLNGLNNKIKSMPKNDQAATLWDLCLVSVLLDAGAGDSWNYHPAGTSIEVGRSEGLALASLFMFEAGLFSSDPKRPWQVDARGLQQLTLEKLAHAFQVTPSNPLVGLEGRLHLLQTLGTTLERSQYFNNRPSDMFLKLATEDSIQASDVLHCILLGLGPIWPSRLQFEGIPLGDVWEYKPLNIQVPFHKLSQWLSYSMLAPFELCGKKVEGIEKLTGLPEYRNGGLFLDTGVIELKDPAMVQQTHEASSQLIIEWRSLTICLLDDIAPLIRSRLNKNENSLPLASILEGGTWNAGRAVAKEKRGPIASPPLKLKSDGTVF